MNSASFVHFGWPPKHGVAFAILSSSLREAAVFAHFFKKDNFWGLDVHLCGTYFNTVGE